MALSVVVPVYNEERALPGFLRMLDSVAAGREVVFCDGGSTDGTLEILKGRTVVTGAIGRGAQCRLGAQAASGDALFFLHVDSVIGDDALPAVEAALDRGVAWGCLTLAFDERALIYRWGAFFSNLRVRLTGIAFGDQGIFCTREALSQAGGVPDIPIMEDYELSRRLRANAWPRQLRPRIVTSARRFVEGGPLCVASQMRRLRALYRKGVSPERLSLLYRDVREVGDE